MRRTAHALLLAAAAVTASPALADDQYKLLVIAKSSRYHYEFIPIARDSLDRMARLNSFGLTFSTSTEPFDGDLRQYAAVMLLNTPPDEFSPSQRAAFEAYMRGGGNAIVVHRAAIALPGAWPWYEKLVGRSVGVHPMLQTGVVTVADRRSPATFALPERWVWSDEFYVTSNPYKVRIDPVLRVDETSYDPRRIWPRQVSNPMGPEHPIAWRHRYEGGRVFVTTLGHNGDAYRDERYLSHLLGAIYWTAQGLGEAR